jgi:spectinomycin phosphotransferase
MVAQVLCEGFDPPWGGLVRQVAAMIGGHHFEGTAQRELAAVWRERAAEITRIVDRTMELGRRLQARPVERVLCHADIHLWNVLVDDTGRLFIVDWDGVVLAPKERDLMHVDGSVGGPVAPGPGEGSFYGGYGATGLDPLALAYYRYEWVVQELGDYAKRVFVTPGTGEVTLADAVNGFRQLFEPADVVDAAYRSDILP